MDREIYIKRLKNLLLMLTVFTLMATSSFAAQFDLRADTTTLTMPDGTSVDMWGFALGNGPVTIPGPTLEVPPGDTTLVINLQNNLPNASVSIIIPGQAVTLSPVWFGDSKGRFRARSFTTETIPTRTETYTWNNLKPGTYIYHSGTHPAVQVQMGLYGALKKDSGANNMAYPGNQYDNEVILFYSEIDPDLHTNVINGTYGTAAYPSTIGYKPTYFLINGKPYSASQAPLPVGIVDQTVLIRFINAGLKNHAPLLQGAYMSVVAENGNPYPFPKEQYSVLLPAGNTIDAFWTPASKGIYPVYDRRLYLRNGGSPGGGMLAYLSVAGAAGEPLAADDVYNTAEDVPLTVTAPGVMANDTDPNGDTITAIGMGNVGNGSLTLNSDGSFIYVPNTDFNGTDTFTYRCTDGENQSNIASVTITVSPVNDAPVAVDDSNSTTGSTLVVVSVLANDTDVEGDPLAVSTVTQGTFGTVTINADNTVNYTPNAGFAGTDSFTYICNDGTADSNPAMVNISVTASNSVPVAVGDVASVPEDGLVVINVLVNDTDADGDPLTVSNFTQATHGAVLVNTDNTITYTPNPDYSGPDSFTYTCNDGKVDSSAAIVKVSVTPTNDTPVSVDDTAFTAVSASVIVDVLANDTDLDGDTLTVNAVTQGTYGTVTINTGNTVTYSPDIGFIGSDSFTYTSYDGIVESNTATVFVTVTTFNRAPVAVDDAGTTPEDMAVVIDILANDTDLDGDQLSISSITQPNNGTVLTNPDKTVSYTPTLSFNGIDSFTYTCNDGVVDSGVATVTITVLSKGTIPPIALDDSASTTRTRSVVINLIANDNDIDGSIDPATIEIVQSPNERHGRVLINGDGTVTFTAAKWEGTTTFAYTVQDNDQLVSNPATVSVTIGR